MVLNNETLRDLFMDICMLAIRFSTTMAQDTSWSTMDALATATSVGAIAVVSAGLVCRMLDLLLVDLWGQWQALPSSFAKIGMSVLVALDLILVLVAAQSLVGVVAFASGCYGAGIRRAHLRIALALLDSSANAMFGVREAARLAWIVPPIPERDQPAASVRAIAERMIDDALAGGPASAA